MEKSDLLKVIFQFERAQKKFDLILSKDIHKDEAYLDASIQRFEFCYELCWKSLKRCLLLKGIDAKPPKDVFKEAFKLGWLREGDDFWSQMVDDRNQTSHTYNDQTALEIYSRLGSYRDAFSELIPRLRKLFE